MLRAISAAVLFGLMSFVTAVADADDAKPGKKDFKRPDPEAMFKKMDANSDGKVSKEEFTKFFEEMRAKFAEKGKGKFKGKGKGKGGEGFSTKLFEKLDANSDGYLSMEEFKKFGEMRGEFGKKRKKKDE